MPNPLSRARDYFDEFLNAPDQAAYIRSLHQPDPVEEDDWRDFKLHPGSGDEDKVKEIWSEALSGFANGEGGVLIWGLDARKTPQPDGTVRDVVCGLKHIPNPAALRSRLRELQRSMTDPPVGGVEVVDVLDPAKTGEGFVVCYIPESRLKPHQMDVRGRKDFMLRVGDSFVVARPSLLRALFYPQRSTSFSVDVSLQLSSASFHQ